MNVAKSTCFGSRGHCSFVIQTTVEKYDESSYVFFMKVTALIPDSLVKDVKKFSKGKNITESLIIALSEWIKIQRFNRITEKIRKHPLKFSPGFSANSVRALNRKK